MSTSTQLDSIRLMNIRGNVAINYDRGLFAVDNMAQGFSLYTLEDMRFLHKYPTGRPTKRFPKQVGFDEDCRVLVGSSDHGTIYVFDRKTGLVVETLHHEDDVLLQALVVSIIL